MKYLVTLIVCALLTVGLIVLVEAATIEATAFNAVTLVALMSLPIVLLVASIWAVIGFTKTVNRWIAENQVDDCPHHLSTRTTAERDAAIRAHKSYIDAHCLVCSKVMSDEDKWSMTARDSYGNEYLAARYCSECLIRGEWVNSVE
jgi:hypothetical protein